MNPTYDDSKWGAGPGYFGYFIKPSETTPIKTAWDSDTLFLRYAIAYSRAVSRQSRLAP